MSKRWKLRVGVCLLMVIGALSSLAQASLLADVQPVLWLRADAGVNLDGQGVVRWRDQSGLGNDAVADPGSEPELVYGVIGGRPVIRFDGKTTYLRVPHADELNAGSGFSTFVVYYYEGGFRLAQKKSEAAGLEDDAWMIPPRNGLGVAGSWHRDLLFESGEDHLQVSVYDGTLGTIKLYRNGALLATIKDVPAQVPNSDDLYIGKRHHPAGSEGHLDGDIAEFIVFDVALSDDQRSQVEAYLLEKYRL